MPTDSRRINGPEDSFDPSVLLVDKKTREVNILFILLICLFMIFVARYRHVSKPHGLRQSREIVHRNISLTNKNIETIYGAYDPAVYHILQYFTLAKGP